MKKIYIFFIINFVFLSCISNNKKVITNKNLEEFQEKRANIKQCIDYQFFYNNTEVCRRLIKDFIESSNLLERDYKNLLSRHYSLKDSYNFLEYQHDILKDNYESVSIERNNLIKRNELLNNDLNECKGKTISLSNLFKFGLVFFVLGFISSYILRFIIAIIKTKFTLPFKI
ncbi:MAG: hypothetical protein KatS3mg068_1566 [Candidatus Sericytochromatia bacterium]|nr:MAG: hypothetical protein KatS3mg068_1566 [Candidatus Sericytochromatia bacterium]